ARLERSEETIHVEGKAGRQDVPPETADEVIVAAASSELTPQSISEDVEHHPVVIVEPAEFAEIEQDMPLPAGAVQQPIHTRQSGQRRPQFGITPRDGCSSLQHLVAPIESGHLQDRLGL